MSDKDLEILMLYPKSNLTGMDPLSLVNFNTGIKDSGLEGKILAIMDVPDDQDLEKIINVNGYPTYIFCNHMCDYRSNRSVDIYTVTAWLSNQIQTVLANTQLPGNVSTDVCANFIVNKEQINRYLTIKLCDILGVSYNYTWSGVGSEQDLSLIINEKNSINDSLIERVFDEIASPITHLEKKWITVNADEKLYSAGYYNYGGNKNTWDHGLCEVVSSSAVSLITESVWTQHASVFTEKTAYALMGLTFPIWVGGVNMASHWEKYGFDIFTDVIDHSYQNMPTLLERCFYAFYLNQKVLTDLSLAAELRNTHMNRLLDNRNKLFKDTIQSFNNRSIASWPTPIRQAAIKILAKTAKL